MQAGDGGDGIRSGRRGAAIGVALAIVVVAAAAVWMGRAPLLERLCRPLVERHLEAFRAVGEEDQAGRGQLDEAGGQGGPATPETAALDPRWDAIVERAHAGGEFDCAAIDDAVTRLGLELDRRSGWDAGSTAELFVDAARRAATRPPVASGDLRSYEALLANVFHLFRALGRQRIVALGERAAAAGELDEPAAAAAYLWLVSRHACGQPADRIFTERTLGDYAIFLLDTVGGQAYLRRRSPRHEALASVYALALAARARRAGQEPHGFDPRPQIARTRALIAASGLAHAETYLSALGEIERGWTAEAGRRSP